MKRYFTSDWHLGSELILEKCHRPFNNIQQMDKLIIHNATCRLKKDQSDILYHVGDFMCYKNDRGFKGTVLKQSDYLKQIDRNIIFIRGNHDDSNRVKCHMDSMITNIGPYSNVSVSHYPSMYKETECLNLPRHHIHLCGHVHGDKKWLYFYDKHMDILNINVGIDLWNYQIVSESRIVELIQKIIPTLNR